jgi:hypothetical protein
VEQTADGTEPSAEATGDRSRAAQRSDPLSGASRRAKRRPAPSAPWWQLAYAPLSLSPASLDSPPPPPSEKSVCIKGRRRRAHAARSATVSQSKPRGIACGDRPQLALVPAARAVRLHRARPGVPVNERAAPARRVLVRPGSMHHVHTEGDCVARLQQWRRARGLWQAHGSGEAPLKLPLPAGTTGLQVAACVRSCKHLAAQQNTASVAAVRKSN